VAGKTAGVVFVVDALAAWLVGLVADAGRKKLTSLVLGEPRSSLWRSEIITIHHYQKAPGSQPDQAR
jgi:hypothetical protein